MISVSQYRLTRGWSYGKRFHAQELRSGRRRNPYIPPTSLWNDPYFDAAFQTGLANLNASKGFKELNNVARMPQYNALSQWFAIAPIDGHFQGHKHHYDKSPLFIVNKMMGQDRYGGQVFRHKSARQSLLLDPTQVPLYNNLPSFYKAELEEIPSDEYLYSNQTLEYTTRNHNRKYDVVPHPLNASKSVKHEYRNFLPERRPQWVGGLQICLVELMS